MPRRRTTEICAWFSLDPPKTRSIRTFGLGRPGNHGPQGSNRRTFRASQCARFPFRGTGAPYDAPVVALWIVLGVVVLLVLYVSFAYNGLVRFRNRVDNAWAQVDVQLRRRYDLIPNLVETVKGYAAHERETFEAVTQARARAQAAQGPQQQGEAEGLLGQALGRLFAVAEAYPELQAD